MVGRVLVFVHRLSPKRQAGFWSCLNVKISHYQYRNSHYNDNTASWLSYLYDENFTYQEILSWYWDSPQNVTRSKPWRKCGQINHSTHGKYIPIKTCLALVLQKFNASIVMLIISLFLKSLHNVSNIKGDISKRFMMTSSNGSIFMLLDLCAGNSPVNGEFPSQRPVTLRFDVSFDLAWRNGWVNNQYAGDLRRHYAHYDVTVMGGEIS